MASQTGLAGDEQGDKKNHGGRDKAIHAYPVSHYPIWAAEHPSLAASFQTGSFGENLVVEGVIEVDICLGDRWRIGDALCEVSQGRQPCWKLNVRFGVPDMAVRVQRSGRTGTSGCWKVVRSWLAQRQLWSRGPARNGQSRGFLTCSTKRRLICPPLPSWQALPVQTRVWPHQSAFRLFAGRDI